MGKGVSRKHKERRADRSDDPNAKTRPVSVAHSGAKGGKGGGEFGGPYSRLIHLSVSIS